MLDLLAALPPATWLQQSGTAYLVVNAAHIVFIGVLIGSIAALDLRLLGAGTSLPLESAGPYLSRLAAVGLGLALLTGLWLFSVQPHEYVTNPAFLAKMVIVALGVLNALFLHGRQGWRLSLSAGTATPAIRLQAALSLVVWVAAVLAGRWIAFV